jgi:hypothetical protein
LVKGFQSLFSPAKKKKVTTGIKKRGNGYKWGTALLIKDNIPILEEKVGNGKLEHRVVSAKVVLPTTNQKPITIGIHSVYAPVLEMEREAFFNELVVYCNKWEVDQHWILGDLNCFWDDSCKWSSINRNGSASDDLHNLVGSLNLNDAAQFNGFVDIHQHYTCLDAGSSTKSRIDYILMLDARSVIQFKTILDHYFKGNHNPIVATINLQAFNSFKPNSHQQLPRRIQIDKSNQNKVDKFQNEVSNWFRDQDWDLVNSFMVGNNNLEQRVSKLDEIVGILKDPLVKIPDKIWHRFSPRKFTISTEESKELCKRIRKINKCIRKVLRWWFDKKESHQKKFPKTYLEKMVEWIPTINEDCTESELWNWKCNVNIVRKETWKQHDKLLETELKKRKEDNKVENEKHLKKLSKIW